MQSVKHLSNWFFFAFNWTRCYSRQRGASFGTQQLRPELLTQSVSSICFMAIPLWQIKHFYWKRQPFIYLSFIWTYTFVYLRLGWNTNGSYLKLMKLFKNLFSNQFNYKWARLNGLVYNYCKLSLLFNCLLFTNHLWVIWSKTIG